MTPIAKKRTKRPVKKKAPSFKTYVDENGKRSKFTVFIIHGHSNDWKKVKKYIESKLRFQAVVVIEKFRGTVLLDKVRKPIWQDCDCAVAIMSADDLSADGSFAARPNVLIEIGYTMGFYDGLYYDDDDIHPVILLKEEKTNVPADLQGLEYISYPKNQIDITFPFLGEGLNSLFKSVADYYKEEDDEEEE